MRLLRLAIIIIVVIINIINIYSAWTNSSVFLANMIKKLSGCYTLLLSSGVSSRKLPSESLNWKFYSIHRGRSFSYHGLCFEKFTLVHWIQIWFQIAWRLCYDISLKQAEGYNSRNGVIVIRFKTRTFLKVHLYLVKTHLHRRNSDRISIFIVFSIEVFFILYNTIYWDCGTRWLQICREVKPNSQWFSRMTLKHQMMRIQSWSSGECGLPHHSHYPRVYSDPEM